MAINITFPWAYIPDPTKGKPVFNGSVYIGQPDLDPEILANRITVTGFQEDGNSVTLTQPIATNAGGVPTYNGSPVRLGVDQDFSIKVLNKLGAQVYYDPNVKASSDADIVSITSVKPETIALIDQQTTVTFSSVGALGAEYHLSGPEVDDGRLTEKTDTNPGGDYTITGDLTIELERSYPAGTLITASTPGKVTTVSTPKICMTKAEFEVATLFVGDCVEISDLGNAQVIVRDNTYTPLTGDLTTGNGLNAELLPNSEGAWSVLWFGVKDDQSSTLGNQLPLFENAAIRADATSGVVIIPDIKVTLSGANLTYDVLWKISQKFTSPSLPGVAPTFVLNLSIFGGKVEVYRDSVDRGTVYYGDGSYRWQSTTGRIQTTGQVTAASTNGAVSLLGATCTSFNDSLTPDQSGIGVTGKVLADNETTGHSAWGAYHEALRQSGVVTSNVYGCETNISNAGSTARILEPYDALVTDNTVLVGHAISFGLTGYTGPISAVSYWTRTAASTRANKGLVVFDESIETGANLAEVIAMPENHGFSWYNPSNELGVFVKYLEDPTDGNQFRVGVGDATNTTYRSFVLEYGKILFGSGVVDIGETTSRFKTIYLVNSPDVSSDETLKSQRGALTEPEVRAAINIAKLPRMFQWLAEIDDKTGTGETVYLHCSPMAQEVWTALQTEGLDPTQYGFISNVDGAWSLQPQELLWMICAAQQQKLDSIEARLDAAGL